MEKFYVCCENCGFESIRYETLQEVADLYPTDFCEECESKTLDIINEEE